MAEEAHAVVARHPELSVGVIAFYAAQRNAILEAASDSGLGLTERDDEDGYRIRDEWRRTGDGRERLRIGTPSMRSRGKEFDVVFLSLTRSNEVPVKDEAHAAQTVRLPAAGEPALRGDEPPAPVVVGRRRPCDGRGPGSGGVRARLECTPEAL